MTSSRDLAALAALLADETRASFLLALLDGRAWTAGELARHARVAPSTTSEHLGKLVAGGLLTEERQGRHRYVRLADDRVAHLVEELAGYTDPGNGPAPRTLRCRRRRERDGPRAYLLRPSRRAAGHRGHRGHDRARPAASGHRLRAHPSRGRLVRRVGPAHCNRAAERPLVRSCLDWTERKPHLAGVAGAALCRHALDSGWCVRIGSERAVKVTADGERAFAELLGIEPEILR